MSTMAKTTVTLTYTDLPEVILPYPVVYTKPAEIIPLGLRHVLSSTQPAIAPEIHAMWRAVRTASQQGKRFRSLRPGDRVSVKAVEAEYTWELTERGFVLTNNVI